MTGLASQDTITCASPGTALAPVGVAEAGALRMSEPFPVALAYPCVWTASNVAVPP